MPKPNLEIPARLMLQIGGPNVSDLIRWLDENRNRHETIKVHSWVDAFWYVVIKDSSLSDEPNWGNVPIGFTVDVVEDRIFWANQQTYAARGFRKGGNCFCRSERWWRKMTRKFPEARSDRKDPVNGTVHDYRTRKSTARLALGEGVSGGRS